MAVINIVAQLQAQGVGQFAQSLRSQLRGIDATVNINTSSATRGLTQLTTGAAATSAAMRQMQTQAAAAGGSLNATLRVAADGTGILQNLATQAGLAARRFTAMAVAAGGMVAVVRLLREGVSAAVDFDLQMNKVAQATSATAAGIGEVRDRITQLSTSMGVSSKALAEVSLSLAQAGLRGKDLAAALEVVAQADLTPGFKNMQQAADALSTSFAQFKLTRGEFGAAIGSMNAISKEFAVSASDLAVAVEKAGGAFQSVAGDTKTAVQSLSEFEALFTTIRASTRESADSIAAGMNSIFGRIQRADTITALKDLGVNLRLTKQEADALGDSKLENQFVGAYEGVRRLSEALSGLRGTDVRFAQITELLGGYRNISSALPLIKQFEQAERAKNVAIAGGITLQVDAEKRQDALANKVQRLKEEYLDLFRKVVDDKGFQGMADAVLRLADGFAKVLDYARPLIPALTTLAAIKIGTSLPSILGSAGRSFLAPVGSTLNTAQPRRLAFGGHVPGSGSGDTVPALLTPGEFVMTKDAVRRIGVGTLTNLNNGSARGYARGGRVGAYSGGDLVERPDGSFRASLSTFPADEFPDLHRKVAEAAAAIGRPLDRIKEIFVKVDEQLGPQLVSLTERAARVASVPTAAAAAAAPQAAPLLNAFQLGLLQRNMPLVERTANRFKNIDHDDAVSAGSQALLNAAKSYDVNALTNSAVPGQPTQAEIDRHFQAYSTPAVKSAIIRAKAARARQVGVTASDEVANSLTTDRTLYNADAAGASSGDSSTLDKVVANEEKATAAASSRIALLRAKQQQNAAAAKAVVGPSLRPAGGAIPPVTPPPPVDAPAPAPAPAPRDPVYPTSGKSVVTKGGDLDDGLGTTRFLAREAALKAQQEEREFALKAQQREEAIAARLSGRNQRAGAPGDSLGLFASIRGRLASSGSRPESANILGEAFGSLGQAQFARLVSEAESARPGTLARLTPEQRQAFSFARQRAANVNADARNTFASGGFSSLKSGDLLTADPYSDPFRRYSSPADAARVSEQFAEARARTEARERRIAEVSARSSQSAFGRVESLVGEGGSLLGAASARVNESVRLRGGAVSDDTRAHLVEAALHQEEVTVRRELLSAQRNLLAQTLPNVTATEREKIAREQVEAALRGEVNVIRSGSGRLLGTEAAVAQASAAGVIAPGASGGPSLRGRIGGFFAPGGAADRFASGTRLGRFGASAGNFLGGPGGLAAALLLPTLAAQLEASGGTAEQAVAGGDASLFRQRRGGAGFLQGAVTGGTVGATVGSLVPIPGIGTAAGAAIGALVGGFAGLVSSLKDAENDIRSVKINNALTDFADKVGQLAAAGGASLDPSVIASARSALAARDAETSAKNREAATGTFSGFDLSAYQSLQRRSLRQDFAPQLPAITQSLAKQAEAIGRANVGGSLEELSRQLREGNNGLNREFTAIIASLRGLSVSQVEKEQAEAIARGQRSAQQERQALESRAGEDRSINSFGRLLLAVEESAGSLSLLQTKAKALADIFEGSLGSSHVSGGVSKLEQLGRSDRGGLQTLDLIASVGGEQGARLRGLGGAAGEARNALASIIPQVLQGNPAKADDLTTAVAKALRDRIGGTGDAGTVVATVTRELNRLQQDRGPSAVFEHAQADSSAFIDKLLEPVLGPVKDIGGKIAKQLEEEANQFIDGLSHFSRQVAQQGETLDARAAAQVSRLRAETQIAADRAGRHGQALDSLSVEQLNAGQQSRLERLTGFAGADAADPAAVGRRLAAVRGQLGPALERQQDVFNRTAGKGDEYVRAADEVRRLKESASNLQQALRSLADVSNRTAAAQEKLNRLQQEKDSRLGFGERFLTASPEEQARINRGTLLANQAVNRGSFDGFVASDIKLIVETLHSLGSSTLTGFKGAPRADDALRLLLANTGGGVFGLTGRQKDEERTLQNQIADGFRTAEAALTELAQAQKEASGEFFSNLSRQHEQFFTRLAAALGRDQLTGKQNELADASRKRAELGGLSDQAKLLGRVGITDDGKLASLRGSRADIESLTSAYAVVAGEKKKLGDIVGSGRLAGQFNGEFGNIPGDYWSLHQRGIDATLPDGNADRVRKVLGAFPGLTDDQRDNIITRYSAAAPDRVRDFVRSSGQTQGPAVRDVYRQVLEESIRQELDGRSLEGKRSVRSGAELTIGRLEGRLRGQGVNVDALRQIGEEDGGAQKLSKAFAAFDSTGVSLKKLGEDIRETDRAIVSLNGQIDRLREKMAAERTPAENAALGGLGTVQTPRGGGYFDKPYLDAIRKNAAAADPFSDSPTFKVKPLQFSSGGTVGPKGTDTVPAYLTPGEAVIPADAVKANKRLVKSLVKARGALYMAGGGVVDDPLGDSSTFRIKPLVPPDEPRPNGVSTKDGLDDSSTFKVKPLVPPAPPEEPGAANFTVKPLIPRRSQQEIDDERSAANFRGENELRQGIGPRGVTFERNQELAKEFAAGVEAAKRKQTPEEEAREREARLDRIRRENALDPNNIRRARARARAAAAAQAQAQAADGGIPAGIEPGLRAAVEVAAFNKQEAAINSELRFQRASNPFGASALLLARRAAESRSDRPERRIVLGGAAIARLNFAGNVANFNRRALLSGAGRPGDEGQRNIAGQSLTIAGQANNDFAKGDYSYDQYRRRLVQPQGIGLPPRRFAAGGRVDGLGSGDTVPALLTPGEFVLNRNAVARAGSDNVARLNAGGQVGGSASGSDAGTAMAQLAAAMTQFAQQSGGFGQAAQEMGKAVTSFVGSSHALVEALNNMPRSLKVEGTYAVNVNHNGAEVLSKLNPQIQQLVTEGVKEALNRVFKDKMPEAGVQID